MLRSLLTPLALALFAIPSPALQELSPAQLVPEDASALIPNRALGICRIACIQELRETTKSLDGMFSGWTKEELLSELPAKRSVASWISDDRPIFILLAEIDPAVLFAPPDFLFLIPAANPAGLALQLNLPADRVKYQDGGRYLGFSSRLSYPKWTGKSTLGTRLPRGPIACVLDGKTLFSISKPVIEAAAWAMRPQLEDMLNSSSFATPEITAMAVHGLSAFRKGLSDVLLTSGDIRFCAAISEAELQVAIDFRFDAQSPLAHLADSSQLQFAELLPLIQPDATSVQVSGINYTRIGELLHSVEARNQAALFRGLLMLFAVPDLISDDPAEALSIWQEFSLVMVDGLAGLGNATICSIHDPASEAEYSRSSTVLVGGSRSSLLDSLDALSATRFGAMMGFQPECSDEGHELLSLRFDREKYTDAFHLNEQRAFDMAVLLREFGGGFQFGLRELDEGLVLTSNSSPAQASKLHGDLANGQQDAPIGFLFAAKELGSAYPFLVQTTDLGESILEEVDDPDSPLLPLSASGRARLESSPKYAVGYSGIAKDRMVMGFSADTGLIAELLELVFE